MSRKIAIELEVNGVKESITTIGELENSIEQLTEELKNTEIGSERFQQLSNDLNKANSQLKGLEQTFEGLDPQQQTQAYLAFGESVVSGVLLAQEALRAFGVENEQVNAAVEKSTQAINIALQARIVVEGILEARILATSLAQKALNTSVVAGNRVLKVLFTTMAANPVGAVLAVVGLLVTAFIALSDSTEEVSTSTEKLKDVNEEAAKSIAKTSVELEFYAGVVNDTTKSEEERALALEELNRLGVITDDITLDNVDSLDKLNERLELARENILLKAQTEAAAALLAESLKEQIKVQNTTIEENIGLFDKIKNSVLSFGNVYTATAKNIQDGAENQQEAINKTGDEVSQYQKIYLEFLEQLLENEAKLTKERKEAGRDIKEQENNFKRFEAAVRKSQDEVKRLNDRLLDFGETPTPKVIDDLERLITLQTELRNATEESRKTLGDAFTEYFEDTKLATTATDTFGDEYEKTRGKLTETLLTGNEEEFKKTIEESRKAFFSFIPPFDEEQKSVVNELLTSYQILFSQLQGLGLETEDEFKSVVEPLLNSLGDKLRLEGDIKFEVDKEEVERTLTDPLSEGQFRTSSNVRLEPITDTSSFEDFIDITKIFREQEDRITEYELTLEDALKGTDEFYERRTDLVSRFTEQFLKESEFVKIAEEDQQKARELATQAAEERVESIINIATETTKVEDSIRGVGNEVEDLRNNVRENNTDIDVLLGLIIQNFDDIKEEFDLTELDPTADLKTNFETLSKFFEDIGFESFDILVRTEQDKLDIIEFFLKKRQELIEEQAKDEEEVQEKTLQNTLDNYTQILDGLNQLTLSLGEASQLQIERVEANTQRLLNNVVGDTKESEELRTEIQEESTKKIVEIERRARLRELQFTKIQATADLAQSLINALKLPPPFNAIQAGIIGTAGSIQIATIQGQIDDLQSAQGFATGGFVEGPGTSTSDSIPAMLSNGEFVINAKSTKKFLPLLEEINNDDKQFKMFSNGGFVLDSGFIPSTNIQNNFDDSRIIEELRKTRQEPLRAYVFEKDITEAQQVEKRLQDLSKL